MGKTKCGVYYDLTESEFTVQIEIAEFFFSSKSHKTKFIERLPQFENEMNSLMKRKWGLNTKFKFIAALALYLKIETRGFYITVEQFTYNSLESFEREWCLTFLHLGGD